MTMVKAGDSVFYECQERLRFWRNEHTTQPLWLILGDDEMARLNREISHMLPLAARAVAVMRPVTNFQGVNVAHFAVPSYLEIVG